MKCRIFYGLNVGVLCFYATVIKTIVYYNSFNNSILCNNLQLDIAHMWKQPT